MSSTVADLPAETLDSYLDAPVESPPDAAPVEELQTTPDGLNEGQSGSPDEQLATDTGEEQPTPETTESADVPEQAAASAPNWDSPENPYFQAKQVLDGISQLAEQQKREKEETERRDSWRTIVKSLPEADESDLPQLADSLIEDISHHAVAQVEQARQELAHAFTAMLATMENELTPAQMDRIRAGTQEWRQRGRTPAEIENALAVSRSERQKLAEMKTGYETQIKNLTAQLAAKTLAPANRAETTTHGDTAATNFDGLSEDEKWQKLLRD